MLGLCKRLPEGKVGHSTESHTEDNERNCTCKAGIVHGFALDYMSLLLPGLPFFIMKLSYEEGNTRVGRKAMIIASSHLLCTKLRLIRIKRIRNNVYSEIKSCIRIQFEGAMHILTM